MRYISEDDIVFDNEQDCREHEATLNKMKDSMVLFDEFLNVIDVKETNRYGYLQVLANPEAVQQYIEKKTGWCYGVDKVGIYQMTEAGDWQDVDALIQQYTKKLNTLTLVKHQILENSHQR